MLRVLLDTNVLVSALIRPTGTPGRILTAWLNGVFEVVLSPGLLDELRRSLQRPRVKKYVRLTAEDLDELLSELAALAIVVEGKMPFPGRIRDASDEHVLVAAIEAKADYIVTGDDDLLALAEYDAVRIVAPRKFVAVLQELK